MSIRDDYDVSDVEWMIIIIATVMTVIGVWMVWPQLF